MENQATIKYFLKTKLYDIILLKRHDISFRSIQFHILKKYHQVPNKISKRCLKFIVYFNFYTTPLKTIINLYKPSILIIISLHLLPNDKIS
jgi:hypothetical protein